jgi:hypothetical protein
MRNKYTNSPWLQERFNGTEAYLWFKARKMVLLSKPIISELDLVNMDSEHLSFHSSRLEETNGQRKCLTRKENTDNPIRTLIDLIVTQWKPENLNKKRLNITELHWSLTLIPWDNATTTFGKRL